MSEQILTLVIQILFPLALFKFVMWNPFLGPLLRRRNRGRGRLVGAVPRVPRRRLRDRFRRPPPPPDWVEAAYERDNDYRQTPLSDELYSAIRHLLVIYGALDIDARRLAEALELVKADGNVREVVRIRSVVDRLAERDDSENLELTAYMMTLAERLQGLNSMRSLP